MKRIQMTRDEANRKRIQAATALLGKTVHFMNESRVVYAIAEDGMIRLTGLRGEFAPNLFKAIGE